jgi:tetratricopeptide (TPR) repeat protein
MYHQVATDYADMLTTLGRFDEAKQLLDRVFAAEEANKSTVVGETNTARAKLALAEKAWPEAVSFAQRSVAAFETQGGLENPKLGEPLTVLAKAKIGAGDTTGARPLLERAIAIGERSAITDYDLKPTRELLAGLPK